MNSEETTIWKGMAKAPASIVLVVYTFISVWFVGGLSVFHLYLISKNQVRNHSTRGSLRFIMWSSVVFPLIGLVELSSLINNHAFPVYSVS